MPYFLVNDFKAGLDVRKSILTAPAGSLTRLVNAAISPGGEIVKRRAFVKVAKLTGTFGLASIGTRVVAFTRNQDVQQLDSSGAVLKPGMIAPTIPGLTDASLEYAKLPNASPTARLADFDTFDGKLYVVLYDATPSPPIAGETGATLPAGVPDGKTYRLPDGKVKVWKKTAWKDWEANKRVGYMPARGYNNSTFKNLTNGNIYEVNYADEWTDWKPTDKGAGVPTGASGDTIISLTAGTSTSPGGAYNNLFGDAWSKITAALPSGVELGRPSWATGTQYGRTPVGADAPDYMSSGDTFMDTSNGNVYVVKGKKWAAWYPDGSGPYLPSNQMEGYTVFNYNEQKAYVTKNQAWEEWKPDHEVTVLPTAYPDGFAFKRTTDNATFVWRTSGWLPWGAPEYDPTKTYAVDAYATYKGSIYRCKTPTTPGPFVFFAWELKGVSTNLKAMNPHYYYDDRDKVNDELVQNLDQSWEWTTKANDKKDSYVETEGSGMGLFVRAYKSKMYCVGDKYLRFCAVDNAFLWEPSTDPNDTTRTGANYINVALQEGASSQLRGVEIYYDKLALLSEYTTQVWTVVSDPKQNALGQVLRATGTRSPWSVQQYGSGDILFLASSGIRSLKARDLSNSAAVSDIGSPIDDYVRALPDKYAKTTRSGPTVYPGLLHAPETWAATSSDKENFYFNARAILEPIVGRFWLAFPREIMVLSAFPGPNVTAWSTYKTDFDIDYIVVAGDRVFVRSGDDLYLFGGVDGKTYDNCGVEVRLPYHDGGKPGHMKTYSAVDVTSQGDWDVAAAVNYDNPDAEEEVAHIRPSDPAQPASSSTWNKGQHELTGYASHLSLRFYNRSAGPATLSDCAIHYAIAGDAD